MGMAAKMSLSAALIACLSSVSLAQPTPVRTHPFDGVETLLFPSVEDELKLSENQKAEVKTIREKLKSIAERGDALVADVQKVNGEARKIVTDSVVKTKEEKIDLRIGQRKEANKKAGEDLQTEFDSVIKEGRAVAEDCRKSLLKLVDGLNVEQVKRFKQLQVQSKSWLAFGDESVQAALQLTVAQKDEIRSEKEALIKGFLKNHGSDDEVEAAGMEKLLKILTDQQRATWKELTGAKHEFKRR
jgi:hypothetical protein